VKDLHIICETVGCMCMHMHARMMLFLNAHDGVARLIATISLPVVVESGWVVVVCPVVRGLVQILSDCGFQFCSIEACKMRLNVIVKQDHDVRHLIQIRPACDS